MVIKVWGRGGDKVAWKGGDKVVIRCCGKRW